MVSIWWLANFLGDGNFPPLFKKSGQPQEIKSVNLHELGYYADYQILLNKSIDRTALGKKRKREKTLRIKATTNDSS
jgi:hypothetical protein